MNMQMTLKNLQVLDEKGVLWREKKLPERLP
jgi:hypothetical protein